MMRNAGLAWLGLALAACWFVWLLRRLQVYWDTGQGRVMALGRALREAERDVADEKRRWETLGHQIKQANAQAEKSRRDEQDLRQKMAALGPPPTVEILVAAEFPSSASEGPWVANMMPRSSMAKGGAQKPVLFWASDYPAAVVRAKRLAEQLNLAVNDIRKFAKAGSG
jgi:hypothetical protein